MNDIDRLGKDVERLEQQILALEAIVALLVARVVLLQSVEGEDDTAKKLAYTYGY